MKFLIKLSFFIILQLISHLSYSDKIEQALNAMEKSEWLKAINYSRQAKSPELEKIILAQKFLAPNADNKFEEIVNFLQKNPKWPRYKMLKEQAENLINNKTSYQLVRIWFKNNQPTTPNGYKFYAYSVINDFAKGRYSEKERIKRNNIIRKGWIMGNFSDSESDDFLRRFKNIITESDHVNRINMLLWNNDINGAKKLLKLTTKSHQRMFEARIAALKEVADANKLYSKLDEKNKYRSGLLYSYINFKMKQNPESDITDLIMHAPNDEHHSKEWWKLKSLAIRDLIKRKQYKKAYFIASKHVSSDVQDKTESSWLAGWLALNFLHSPQKAIKHFAKFYENVQYPISVSRGAYWLARAHFAANNKQDGMKWMARAAAFPETFYGQIAHEAIQKPTFTLASKPYVRKEEIMRLQNSDLIKAISLLIKYKRCSLAQIYMKTAISVSSNPAEVVLITGLAKQNYKHNLALEVAKLASQKQIMLVDYNYPKPYLIPSNRIEPAFAYAIMRQESLFDPNAVSTANAQGLMQIIPDTAKRVAKSLNISYIESKLKNPEYNINLGTKYLKDLLAEFNGSYILAIASYNAGPHKSRDWINEYGDPRKMKNINEVINWIEMIPYYETRNYVQRVMENIQVYRFLIEKNQKIQIRKDLMR